VVGGYNSEKKKMVDSCEFYDFKSDRWQLTAKISTPKCAFASTVVSNSEG